MSNKPLIFYGVCCGTITLLGIMGVFTKGAQPGIASLITGILFMATLLCIVYYSSLQSSRTGWVSGIVCICCSLVITGVSGYIIYNKFINIDD